jgi:hypothetical protein
MNDAPKKEDLQAKRELAQGAEELMANKAFKHAIQELHDLYLGQMMATLDRNQRDELIAMMKALANIPAELKVIINNYRTALDRQRTHG